MEDKLFARFQEEKKRKVRNSSLFNLTDDLKDEDLLTHKGRLIDDYADAEVDRLSSDDDDDMDLSVAERLHFGGGEEDLRDPSRDGDHPKSHKEIMAEVIAKSKFHKAQRQKAKEERDDLTEALDDQFSSIQQLLSFRPKKVSFKLSSPRDCYFNPC